MPSPELILRGLTAIANEFAWLAVAWHTVFAVFILGLILGWRPPNHLTGALLTAPAVSVGTLAWLSGNPFNGALFVLLAIWQAAVVAHLSTERVTFNGTPHITVGTSLILFAWFYPHFLETPTFMAYAYAAPLGLLPCPTLAAVIGFTLVLHWLHSRAWALTVAVVGMFYGVLGVVRLGVALDVVLLIGAVWLAGSVVLVPTARSTFSPDAKRGHSGEAALRGDVLFCGADMGTSTPTPKWYGSGRSLPNPLRPQPRRGARH